MAETIFRLRAALRELKSEFPKTRFVFASYWSLAAQKS